MKRILSLVAVMMLLGVVAVYGQAIGDLKGKMAVGAFLDYGIGFGDQFKSVDETIGSVTISAKNKLQLSFGGQFIYGLAPKMAVKGILDYQTEKVEASTTGLGALDISTSETGHWLEISANGMYFLSPEKKMCLYLEAGPGMYMFSGGGSSSSKLGINAGVGGIYMINDKLALDYGGRFHMVFTDVKNMTYLDIHAGVNFFLGGE